jgi:ribose transport system permease protein
MTGQHSVTTDTTPQTASPAPAENRLKRLHHMGVAPLLVLIVLVIIVSAYDSSFLMFPSLMSLLEQSAPLVLLAIAQGLVVLTGRITLANAGLASLAGVLLAKMLESFGAGAVPAVLIVSTLLGLIIGVVHVGTQLPSFIVTLGFLGVFAGLALWLSGADSILVTTGYDNVEWISFRLYGIPISFLIVLVLTAALMAVLKVFPLGRRIRAIGFNERAAAFSGIRTTRVVVLIFALSGALSGLAAVFQVAQLQSAGATTSDSLLLPSIAAVIVGGCAISGGVGGIGRILLGSLVIALLRVGLDLVGVNSAYQPILYGLIVILAIAATVDRRRGTAVA